MLVSTEAADSECECDKVSSPMERIWSTPMDKIWWPSCHSSDNITNIAAESECDCLNTLVARI